MGANLNSIISELETKYKLAQEFLDMTASELRRAMLKHAPLNSHHEAYAVILEELDEYWDEVRKRAENRDPADMLTELIQVAAMCARAAVDLELVGLIREG